MRRLPPDTAPGEYSDAERAEEMEQQKAKAEWEMAQYDAAPRAIRQLWDAVGSERLARQLWTYGVRDAETADRFYRLLAARRASGYQ